MNNVFIKGRITNDLELRQTSKGTSTLTFTVAVDRYGSENADFIRCVAFNKNAENIKAYFGKGRGITILGNLKTGSYEKDGQRIYTTDVWVDRFEFEIADRDGGQRELPNKSEAQPNDEFDGEVISDSELPF